MADGRTLPVRDWARSEKISIQKAYEEISSGEVDTVVVAGRRRVILASWDARLARARAGVERDPKERAAAMAYYRETADRAIARYASKNVTARGLTSSVGQKPQPTAHPRRRHSPSPAPREAEPARPRLASRPAKE